MDDPFADAEFFSFPAIDNAATPEPQGSSWGAIGDTIGGWWDGVTDFFSGAMSAPVSTSGGESSFTMPTLTNADFMNASRGRWNVSPSLRSIFNEYGSLGENGAPTRFDSKRFIADGGDKAAAAAIQQGLGLQSQTEVPLYKQQWFWTATLGGLALGYQMYSDRENRKMQLELYREQLAIRERERKEDMANAEYMARLQTQLAIGQQAAGRGGGVSRGGFENYSGG